MIRCLVVDDEKLAVELMEDNIRQVPFFELAGSCRNAPDAVRFLESNQVDLLFLDIQMPGLSGLQLISSLQNPPMIVLVTAYERYALDGFNLDVLDYLVKPVPFDRFFKAATRAYNMHLLKNRQDARAMSTNHDYLFVNADYSLIRINIPEILYIEGLKDYIKIYVEGADRAIITRLSMRYMEEKLPAERFLRVHRSYIIALDKLTAFKRNKVVVGEVEIPVSETFRDALLSYMGHSL